MKFLNGRYLLIPLLLVAVGLIVAACGEDEPDEPTSVTFMLDWTPNTNHAGVYIAKAKGWYEEAGLDVEIVEPGAGGVPQTVASGAAHFGISVQEAVIPAREQERSRRFDRRGNRAQHLEPDRARRRRYLAPGRPRREDLRRLGRPA